MPASIRGHQGQFKIFENGELVDVAEIVSFDVTQDSDFSRSEYVGRSIPEGDQSIKGWSGSLDAEVKNDVIDAFIDALVTNNLNGIGVSDYTLLLTEQYGDGQTASYIYVDCQFKMSKRQSGLSDKMTKRLEFQSSFRTRL